VDDLDDLLAGRDALDDFLADALLLHAVDELARDLEMNVGGEERGAHLLERLRHVFLGKFADPAEVTQGVAEFFRERFEHGTRTVPRFSSRGKRRGATPRSRRARPVRTNRSGRKAPWCRRRKGRRCGSGAGPAWPAAWRGSAAVFPRRSPARAASR